MPARLNPYVTFRDNNARQAMEFYQQVFGGELALNTFGEFGAEGQPFADNIMHGLLETPGGFTLMGADTPPGTEITVGNTMAVSLSGDDAENLRRWWDALSADGTISVPLERQMWGDEFGMCEDRYGVSWMVNITQPSA